MIAEQEPTDDLVPALLLSATLQVRLEASNKKCIALFLSGSFLRMSFL